MSLPCFARSWQTHKVVAEAEAALCHPNFLKPDASSSSISNAVSEGPVWLGSDYCLVACLILFRWSGAKSLSNLKDEVV